MNVEKQIVCSNVITRWPAGNQSNLAILETEVTWTLSLHYNTHAGIGFDWTIDQAEGRGRVRAQGKRCLLIAPNSLCYYIFDPHLSVEPAWKS